MREECGLCEEFLAELQAELHAMPGPVPRLAIIDVDSDATLRRRHGLDIPVLLLDDVRVCAHRLDRDELLRLLRPRGTPASPLRL